MSGAYFSNLGGVRAVGADAIELDSLDGSTQFIASDSATMTLTRNKFAGKTLLLDRLAGITVTLPAASGSGDVYRFLQSVIPTSNTNVIQVANATDTMVGYVDVLDDTSDNMVGFNASGTDDTITLNLTTTGGNAIGEEFELVDLSSGTWMVRGRTYATGAAATPFSAAVS
jgi:hypothetical protein